MIFTSESVSAGHPDKVCDQISDAILDAALEQDPNSRVAVETLVKDNQVVLAGEITTAAQIDYEAIVRKTILGIGYDKEEYGFNGATCSITNLLGRQSQDISMGVTESENHEQGAGDQGLMFGYAENSTEELMPAPIMLSHQLVRQQADLMLNGSIPWLRPDAKSQVSCIYEGNQIVGIDAVVLSTQHDGDISLNDLRESVLENIIKPILPEKWLTKDTQYHINPTGNFEIGGPVGDAGLTGRKIIVDTYGVWQDMVAGHSQEKTLQKLIEVLHMLLDMLQKILLLLALLSVVKFKSLMRLVLQNLLVSVLILLVQARYLTMKL